VFLFFFYQYKAVYVIISFEDFAECFPQYVEEDKNGSSATFNSISDYIEAQNFVRRVSCHSIISLIFFRARFGQIVQGLQRPREYRHVTQNCHRCKGEETPVNRSQGRLETRDGPQMRSVSSHNTRSEFRSREITDVD